MTRPLNDVPLITFHEEDGTLCVGVDAGELLPFDRVTVARMAGDGSDAMNIALAKVFAAAPDLLDALRDLIETVEDNNQFPDRSPKLIWDSIKRAYAVIAKAEGRS